MLEKFKRQRQPPVFRGKSSDIKPNNVEYFSRFYEKDTGFYFYYSKDRIWVQEDVESGEAIEGAALNVIDVVVPIHLTTQETILDYFNNVSGTFIRNNIYIIKALKNGYLYTYLLKNQNNIEYATSVIQNFKLLNISQCFIEGSFVVKNLANTDIETLEIGDIVYFKPIINASFPMTLIGYTYIGGDKQLETSYQQNQILTT